MLECARNVLKGKIIEVKKGATTAHGQEILARHGFFALTRPNQ